MNSKIKALDILRRVEDQTLTQYSQSLNAAQAAQAACLSRQAALQDRLTTEARTQATEALPYIGRFLATLRKEQAREASLAQVLDKEINTLRDEVMVHFTAEKTYAQLADSQRQAMMLARVQKAEAQIEDMTAARYKRAI